MIGRWVLLVGLFVFVSACSLHVQEVDERELLERALAENDLELCEQITREHWVSLCYSDIATQTQDLAVCDYLEGSSREHCIRNIALSTQEIALCEELRGTTAGDACYNSFARETLDETHCLDIESLQMKNNCVVFLARENKDHNTCLLVEEDHALEENCLFRTMLVEETDEACNRIETRTLRDACYITYAANFGSDDDCDSVSASQQETCEEFLNQ